MAPSHQMLYEEIDMSQLVAITIDAYSWPRSYGCANFLLKEGARILWATQPFTAATCVGGRKELERGTFLITEVPADDQLDWLSTAEQRFEVELLKLDSIEGFEGLPLHPLRIGMYGGGGAPFNHVRIFAELGFLVDFVMPQEIRCGKLAEFDVLGIPGGGWLAMKGQLGPLGKEGCQAISEFVCNGGMYIGFCAGSSDAAIISDSVLTVCPQQRQMRLVNAAVWNRDDTKWVGEESPGVGVLESRNLRPDHPVMFGLPEYFRITHYNGPFFESCPDAVEGASEPVGLATVADFTENFTPSEYFLRFSEFDRITAEQTCLVARAAREGRLNIVAGYYGLGRVILFGSHPEFGYNLAMDRWNVPARMLANAAFWQAGHLTKPRSLSRKVVPGTPISYPLGSGLYAVSHRLGTLASIVHRLRDKSKGTHPAWLAENLAMSTFGLPGEEIWQRNLATFDDMAKELDRTLGCARELAQDAPRLASALRSMDEARALDLADALDDALLGLEEAIHVRIPEEWHQDFGYEGALQMLDRTETMLRKAELNFDVIFQPSPNPYQYFDSSPYHLVAGSYLSALGVFTNARFLLRVHELRLSELVFKGRVVLGGA